MTVGEPFLTHPAITKKETSPPSLFHCSDVAQTLTKVSVSLRCFLLIPKVVKIHTGKVIYALDQGCQNSFSPGSTSALRLPSKSRNNFRTV